MIRRCARRVASLWFVVVAVSVPRSAEALSDYCWDGVEFDWLAQFWQTSVSATPAALRLGFEPAALGHGTVLAPRLEGDPVYRFEDGNDGWRIPRGRELTGWAGTIAVELVRREPGSYHAWLEVPLQRRCRCAVPERRVHRALLLDQVLPVDIVVAPVALDFGVVPAAGESELPLWVVLDDGPVTLQAVYAEPDVSVDLAVPVELAVGTTTEVSVVYRSADVTT